MKLKTLNLIDEVLIEAIKKADAEFNEMDKAARDCFDMLEAALGNSMTDIDLENIYYKSEQYKKRSAARSRLMQLEAAREDFLEMDWR